MANDGATIETTTDAFKQAVANGRAVYGGTAPGDSALEAGDLPPELRSVVGALNDAIENATVPTAFPSEESYPPAFQPKRIAEVLIGNLHQHLGEARIAYVYRDGITKDGQTVDAKMTMTGAKWRELACIDFVLEVNYRNWCELTRRERVRLIDHELCHADEEEDPETGKRSLVARPHDVEEFVQIIRRWGIGRGQKRFAEALRQASLFDDAGS